MLKYLKTLIRILVYLLCLPGVALIAVIVGLCCVVGWAFNREK